MTNSLEKLAKALSRLPGIGRRSAERMAFRLGCGRDTILKDLVEALSEVSRTVGICSRCGALTSSGHDPCRLCTDTSRDGTLLCVVEDPGDVVAIEHTGVMRGRYHVLAGRMSSAAGKGPWDLRLQGMLERLDTEGFSEVVLALGTDMEGDATAGFVSELLKDRKVRVTRLAFGLPAGSGVAYSDPVTLERAIRGRQKA